MHFTPRVLFALCLLAGAVGGLWAVSKPGSRLTRRSVFHVVLGSALVGTLSGMILMPLVPESEAGQYFLIGFAMFLGMLGRNGLTFFQETLLESLIHALTKLTPGRSNGGRRRKTRDDDLDEFEDFDRE